MKSVTNWNICSARSSGPKGFWHRLARVYVYHRNKYCREHIRAHNLRAKSIMDIGCGETVLAPEIAGLLGAHTYLGIDMNLDLVSRRFTDASGYLVIADAETLPGKNNCVDLVMAIGLFNYLKNPVGIIREMRRVSRRYAVFTYPKQGNIMSWLRGTAYLKAVRAGNLGLPENRTAADRRGIEQLCFDNGWKPLAITTLRFPFGVLVFDNEFLVIAERLD